MSTSIFTHDAKLVKSEKPTKIEKENLQIKKEKPTKIEKEKSIRNNDLKSYKSLIENGAEININNDLSFSARLNHLEFVKYLISLGAKIDDDDNNALPQTRNYEILKLLIENGADIHVRNDATLRNNAYLSDFKTIKLLIENGADAKNNEALISSIQSQTDAFKKVKFLIKNGAIVNDDAFITSVGDADIKIVKLLLENGANIHADNDEALFVGLELFSGNEGDKVDFERLKYIISSGANVNARNNKAFEIINREDFIEIKNSKAIMKLFLENSNKKSTKIKNPKKITNNIFIDKNLDTTKGYYLDTLPFTSKQLIQVFGQPVKTGTPEDEHIFEWKISFNKNTFSIYDWENNETFEQCEWHISGKKNTQHNDIITFITNTLQQELLEQEELSELSEQEELS